MTELKPRDDAHVPTGPDDVRVAVYGRRSGRSHAAAMSAVLEGASGSAPFRYVYDGPPRSKRTRFLVWRNATGGIVCAPCMLSHRLSLFFGMGKQWYFGVMAAGGFGAEAAS